MSSVRPMQRTRGPVRPHEHGLVRTSTWSRVRKRSSGAARWRRCVSTSSPVAPSSSSSARARLGVDQLGVDEAARAEVHPVLLLALAPERDADVADPHRLGHPRAPAFLEPRAEGRLAAAGLARDEHALDARAPEIVALGEVGRVRRRQHRRLRPQLLDRADEPIGVPGADRDVGEADPVEGGERRAGDERPGVVGRDDPLARCDPGRGVAARGAGDPVVEVAGRERDVARRRPWCRSSSRSGRARAAPRRGASRTDSRPCASRRSSSFSVSGSCAISASPPDASKPASFSR